jgi:hypothetical protein
MSDISSLEECEIRCQFQLEVKSNISTTFEEIKEEIFRFSESYVKQIYERNALRIILSVHISDIGIMVQREIQYRQRRKSA